MSYSTYFIVTWTWSCIQAVMPAMLQTMPQPIAQNYAVEKCSCVTDKFRGAITEDELKRLTFKQRGEMGEHYARICTGLGSES